MYTTSPKTGRQILVNGPTYLKLAKSKTWGTKLHPRASSATSKGKSKSGSKSGGCSNQNKYIDKGIPSNRFCGTEGGSCPSTFPVNTPLRARAALAYSRHAPNPAGIRRCVHRIAQQEGWEDSQTGKLKMTSLPKKKRTPRRVRRY